MTMRVIIVDDSPFVREVLRAGLSRHADLEIVAEAGDGQTAEKLIRQLRPDVVTMDVVMPLMSGLDAIRNIMLRAPTPIVVVSDARGGVAQLMVEAVGAGAIEVFVKPVGGFDELAANQLAAILRAAARAHVPARVAPPLPTYRPGEIERKLAGAAVLGIVASTGGPPALRDLLAPLPATFPIPIAIVQHTAVGFTGGLVAWLATCTKLPVEVAAAGRELRGVMVAPDDHHMEVSRTGEVVLHRAPPIRGHRPSGTVLLRSLAAFGRRAAGIVCTGMNDDGAAGLAALEQAGGVAIVEDPSTAIIDAMPRAAISSTPGAYVAPIAAIAQLLQRAGKS
jgi:two-component system, chemotaxis family, protein-glutamate methylesterase/glutaminase